MPNIAKAISNIAKYEKQSLSIYNKSENHDAEVFANKFSISIYVRDRRGAVGQGVTVHEMVVGSITTHLN